MPMFTTSRFAALRESGLTTVAIEAEYCCASQRTKEGGIPRWLDPPETTGGQVAITACHLPKGHEGRHEATTSW